MDLVQLNTDQLELRAQIFWLGWARPNPYRCKFIHIHMHTDSNARTHILIGCSSWVMV